MAKARRAGCFAVAICGALLGLHAALVQANSQWECSQDNNSCKPVFVVHNSWHAALVLKSLDIPPNLMPELADFPGATLIEFSWGDEDFFQNPDAGFWSGLKAAFWSSGSVLHLVGLDKQVTAVYTGAEIFELRLSGAAYQRLSVFLARTFSRPQVSDRAPSKPGLFSSSKFYPATPRFSVLRTCNTWVAEALTFAGLPLSPSLVISAGQLAAQVEAHANRQ